MWRLAHAEKFSDTCSDREAICLSTWLPMASIQCCGKFKMTHQFLLEVWESIYSAMVSQYLQTIWYRIKCKNPLMRPYSCIGRGAPGYETCESKGTYDHSVSDYGWSASDKGMLSVVWDSYANLITIRERIQVLLSWCKYFTDWSYFRLQWHRG